MGRSLTFIKKLLAGAERPRKTTLAGLLLAGMAVGGMFPAATAQAGIEEGGWGVNANLSLLDEAELARRVLLLREAGVFWVREDFRPAGKRPLQEKTFSTLRQEGFAVLALVPYGVGQKPAAPENHLQEDLRLVFERARKWAQATENVDAWENYNEPDSGFCRDLPDRSTTYMKAIYLGLKSGGGDKPLPVLMGGVALPPGPWLERAARNGLLQYADGYNFQYYGRPGDFNDVLRAHRNCIRHGEVLARKQGRRCEDLPIWITECGYHAAGGVPADRMVQAISLRAMAGEAREGGVASFMPFALTRRADGLGLLQDTLVPFPAWKAFGDFSKAHRLGLRFPESRPPDSLVLQWLPQKNGALPHKVSGSYRFFDQANGSRRPIEGEIRFYNFGAQPRRLAWQIGGLKRIQVKGRSSGEIEVPAGEMTTIAVGFEPPQEGYISEGCSIILSEEGSARREALYFKLETRPRILDFQIVPWKWSGEGSENKSFHYIDDPSAWRASGSSGPWLGINGLIPVFSSKNDLLRLKIEPSAGQGVPMAIARLEGLPTEGFLRLSSAIPFGPDFSVRVDLVDRGGQRFTIFENVGQSYFERSGEVWLNLKDFHLYFWGRAQNPRFDPSSVREIQLRTKIAPTGKEVTLKIELLVPKGTEAFQ